MGIDKTNGVGQGGYNTGAPKAWQRYEDKVINSLIEFAKKAPIQQESGEIPVPYTEEAWNAMSEEERCAILAKREVMPGLGIERQNPTYAAAEVKATEVADEEETHAATNGNENTQASAEESAGADESDAPQPASEENQNQNTSQAENSNPSSTKKPRQAPYGSPERYMGENKPATNADWSGLDGSYFEAVDEPDSNTGKMPTRPIRGMLTVDDEVQEGENPKKITIHDMDNNHDYVFELDESVTDKVAYKCTSGLLDNYTRGNDYELRTINGVPMLVQMKSSEGWGVAVGKVNGRRTPTPPATQEPPAPPATQEPPAPPATQEHPATPEAPAIPEELQAKINEDAASIALDLTPKKKVDSTLKAKYDEIVEAYDAAPKKAETLKDALSHDWFGASDVEEALKNLSPAEMTAVLAELISKDKNFNIAEKIDNVFNLDKNDVFDLVITKFQARLQELGLEEPKFDDGSSISKGVSLEAMNNWIKTACVKIQKKEEQFLHEVSKQYGAVSEELENIKKLQDAKPIIDAANKTLAEAANANPALEVQYEGEGSYVVGLPDGRSINIGTFIDGSIHYVSIHKYSDEELVDDITYYADVIHIETNDETGKFEIAVGSGYHDFNKILELVKRIFGEKPKDKD